ncbi:hypothetical protein M404DRAFT_1008657 [Pisolithus tinctorius Marx 270]|uniref:Uncharacterized protein n=1 Tax=Pisolithus tinctorius Marx 270 TaxID=870435 RepID=A0A0C3IA39_PISTI|nr:hypothetical protein M404DRAFT_1008657 [Pisolithus tinctorius Marx 270]
MRHARNTTKQTTGTDPHTSVPKSIPERSNDERFLVHPMEMSLRMPPDPKYSAEAI